MVLVVARNEQKRHKTSLLIRQDITTVMIRNSFEGYLRFGDRRGMNHSDAKIDCCIIKRARIYHYIYGIAASSIILHDDVMVRQPYRTCLTRGVILIDVGKLID